MKRISIVLGIIAAALVFGTAAHATDFTIVENMSNAAFTSSAALETINGTSSQLSGDIQVDRSDPSSIRGTVEIPVESLRTGVDLRDEHLRGKDWLNAEANPNIAFEVAEASRRGGATSLEHGATVHLSLTGDLTINGETQTVTVPAQATYYVIEGSDLEGTYGVEGNLIRVVSNFTVNLDDFGVKVAKPLQAKVSNSIEIEVRLTGAESSGESEE